MVTGSWAGQAGCTHQGGVGLDGDQLCPSGAAVLSALLPVLSGRGEVVALPRIPEPANRAKLALPCTPETQRVGQGSWQGLPPAPSPRDQESDSGQSCTNQPIVFVCLPHRDHSALTLTREPSSNPSDP